ncbi:MAG TPA: DMT family transporter [Thermohalobaculum sp.]|nr:DMT family transporter [Thermohalobaculum sp.]
MTLWLNKMSFGSGAVAAFLVISAQGLFALTDSFAPLVANDMSIWQFQAIRAALMLPVAFAVAVMFGSWQRILPRSRGPVALRTVLNVLALGAYFAVLPVLPFGQAAAGFFTTPIWVVIYLSLSGGGAPDRRMWLTLGLGFGGAALAVGVGGELNPLALVPVVAGAVNAASILITNRHCRDEDACALLFWSIAGFLALGLVGVAVAVLADTGAMPGTTGAVLFVQPTAVGFEMLLLSAALGLSSIIGTGLLMRGYQMGKNASVALFDYSYLVWAAVVSATIWGQAPTATGLAGLGLIMLAGMVAVAPRRRAVAIAGQ